MSFPRGTWYFSQPSGMDWLYAVIHETGFVVKYAYNKRGWQQYDFDEMQITDLRDGHHGMHHGRVNLRKLKDPPTQRAIVLELLPDRKLSVRATGSPQAAISRSFEELPPPQQMTVGGIVLTDCCIKALARLNKLPGLAGKVDMISLISDLAGIVDAAEGIPKALNSLSQKAAGGPSLSSLMTPAIKLKMAEVVAQEIAVHEGSNPGRFWKLVSRGWNLDIA